jgi:hypothetical protein
MTFKDDLESLGYMLAFMIKGTLPWSSFQGKPSEFTEYLCELRNPDYFKDGLPGTTYFLGNIFFL